MCDCDCELPKRERWRQITQGEVDRLIRKLKHLRWDRLQVRHRPGSVAAERQLGETNGLDMAIRVLKGEL